MASLGSSFIDKRQGKIRGPKPPPARRNRAAQAPSSTPTPQSPSSIARGATVEQIGLRSPSASATRSHSAGLSQQNNTNADANASHVHSLPSPTYPTPAASSTPAAPAVEARKRRRSPSASSDARAEPTTDTGPTQTKRPRIESDLNGSSRPEGNRRTLRTARANTTQVTQAALPTPDASQVSANTAPSSAGRKRSRRQSHNDTPQLQAPHASDVQDEEATLDSAQDGRPAKKARKIRSDKGQRRGPRAGKTREQPDPQEHPTEDQDGHSEPTQKQAGRPARRVTRGLSEASRPSQDATPADDMDTASAADEASKKTNRKRAATPEELEPERLNSKDTMMFELGRDKKIGPVSNLEQAMRNIDWHEVKKKRYEADVREMEEDLARQAALDAENASDEDARESEAGEDDNSDAENEETSVLEQARHSDDDDDRRSQDRGQMNGARNRRKGRRKGRASEPGAGEAPEGGNEIDNDDAAEAPDEGSEAENNDVEEEATEAGDEEQEPATDTGAANGSGARPRNPRLRFVNGEIQFDNSSFTVDRHAETAAAAEEMAAEDADAIEENDLTNQVNSRSFLAERRRDPLERFYMKQRPESWNDESTARFYDALRMFGTDFQRISKLFPGRTRNHIKRKFNREERTNPETIDKACMGGEPGGLAYFAEAVGREVTSFRDPKVFMGQLEQEKSTQREAIEREQREKQEAMQQKREAARQRQERTKKEREERRRRKEEKRARQKSKNKSVPVDNSVEEIVEGAEAAEVEAAATASRSRQNGRKKTEANVAAGGRDAERAANDESREAAEEGGAGEEIIEEGGGEEVVEEGEGEDVAPVDGGDATEQANREEEEDEAMDEEYDEDDMPNDYDADGGDYFDDGGGSDID